MFPRLHRVAALRPANQGGLSVRVLLISDGRPANETLMAALRDAGHEWLLSQEPSVPWRLARGEMDIALYDLGDADDSGWQILDRWRHMVDLPLLVLGPCVGDVHAVKALRLGADGYLPNPPSSAVLLAYMEAMLRRARQDPFRGAGGGQPGEGFFLDEPHQRLVVGARSVDLSPAECRLLSLLLQRRGRPVPRDELAREIGGGAHPCLAYTLRTTIRGLRRKLGDDPRHAVILYRTRMGYVLQQRTPSSA